MGLPLAQALPMLVDTLDEFELRPRIKVIASGKLITPDRVAWAICVGADFVTSARGFMFALGCIQALQCNKNTCPTGITTHDPRLQRGLVPKDKAERVAHFASTLVKEVGVIAHSCGVEDPRQLQRHHARMVQPNGSYQSYTAKKVSTRQPKGLPRRPESPLFSAAGQACRRFSPALASTSASF